MANHTTSNRSLQHHYFARKMAQPFLGESKYETSSLDCLPSYGWTKPKYHHYRRRHFLSFFRRFNNLWSECRCREGSLVRKFSFTRKKLFFFKKWAKSGPCLFIFSLFSHDKYSTNTINDKRLDSVLGTRRLAQTNPLSYGGTHRKNCSMLGSLKS